MERASATAGQPPRRLLVRFGAGHRLIPVREILRFTADEGLARAVVASGTLLTDYTLAELEHRLSTRFVRASRADLVNVDWIDRLTSDGDGSATLTLRDKSTVHVSRRRASDLRRALEALTPTVRPRFLTARRRHPRIQRPPPRT